MTRPRLAIPLALLGLAALIVVTRAHTYHEPLERDITAYAVIGHELHAGRALYSDVWDHKPPAIHASFWLAEAALGYGRPAVFALTLAAALVTLGATYVAGTAVGGPASGLWAAAFWATTSGDLWLQANQPNTEVFINAALAWAFVLLLTAGTAPGAWGRFVGAGLLVTLASLYKTVAVVSMAPVVALAVAWPPPGVSRRRMLGGLLAVTLAGAAVWALVAAYFAASGRLDAFVAAVFTYNRYYAGSVWANVARGLHPARLFSVDAASLLPLAVLTAVGIAFGLARGSRRTWALLTAFAAGTTLAVAMPGWFHPHYYQLWLPVVAVGGGWAVATIGRPGAADPVRLCAAGSSLVLLLVFQLPLYQLDADDWSRAKYRSDIFVAERNLARELRGLLRDGESFYEFGAEGGLYFETGQRPLTGAFYAYPLLGGPLAAPLTARVIADLERRPPDLFIAHDWVLGAPSHPLLQWAWARYRPAPGPPRSDGFVLLVRPGSDLERRLAAAVTRAAAR